MPKRLKPSADQTAVLLVAMVRRVGGRRGAGSRWRISEKTVRRVAGRAVLSPFFLADLTEELADLGFALLALPIGGYGLIQISVFESWPLIGVRDRLTEELEALRLSEAARFEHLIDSARAHYASGPQEEDDDDT